MKLGGVGFHGWYDFPPLVTNYFCVTFQKGELIYAVAEAWHNAFKESEYRTLKQKYFFFKSKWTEKII